MPELELDIDSHVYRLDGMVIPGCTQVLTAMGATPGFGWLTPDELEFYRSRGHAVHSAVEYTVKGVLDRRTVVDEVKPYLKGWERAVNDLKIEILDANGHSFVDGQSSWAFVEVPLHHSTFRYGVTPDVVARIPSIGDGCIELKATSVHCAATGIQLAAQLLAVRQRIVGIGKMRVGMRLLPEEPYYDFRVYDERSDEAVWLSMLNTYNWLTKHKLLKDRSA